MQKKIRKAIIPAAGYGTRFLPATKALPKEMLPVVDKPVIQYVVEDAVSAGIEDIIIVTGWHKRAIEDHFDYPFELEERLAAEGKQKELDSVRNIADVANFYYLRQRGPRGNATPIMNARDLIGDEPFLLLSGDDIFVPEEGMKTRAQQLVDAYEKNNASIVSTLKRDKPSDYKLYGFVEGEQHGDGLIKLKDIYEKPGEGSTKSTQASMFAGVFTPEVFKYLDQAHENYVKNGSKGEFLFWDAVNLLAKDNPVYGSELIGLKYYDCGNKLEFLKAVVEMGLRHSDIKDGLAEYLRNLKF